MLCLQVFQLLEGHVVQIWDDLTQKYPFPLGKHPSWFNPTEDAEQFSIPMAYHPKFNVPKYWNPYSSWARSKLSEESYKGE